MNILFVGQFAINFDGWCESTKSVARALKTIPDVNLTIRNINMANKPPGPLDLDLVGLQKSFDKYDYIFQQTLPNLFYYDGRATNIGLSLFETEFQKHSWLYRINSLTDRFFVESNEEKNWLDEKLTVPVRYIGGAINTEICKITHPVAHPMFEDKNIFKFLFIGEDIPRKNIHGLLEAYFGEFSMNDNVMLIIKTNNNITDKVNTIKAASRKFLNGSKYPLVYLINNMLPENQLVSLIQHSNVMVAPSYGEAFHRPCATSLCCGKPVIATEGTGICSYLNDNLGWKIASMKDRVYYEMPPIQDIYTSNEFYYKPNIDHLRHCMREAYQNKELYRFKCHNTKLNNIIEEFSYEKLGKRILKALNE